MSDPQSVFERMERVSFEEKQAMLASIVDGSNDAIISKDLDSHITSWNKAAERIFGYTETEMIGQPIYKIIPQERFHEEDHIISTLKLGKRIEHFETVRVTKAGKRLHVSLTISPIKNSKGQIVGASKIARDITPQKENEERLKIINDLSNSINAQLNADNILKIVVDATTRLTSAAYGAFFFNRKDENGETYVLYGSSGASREAFGNLGTSRNTALFEMTFDRLSVVRSDDITKDPRYGKNAPHYGIPKGHVPVVSYLAVPVVSNNGNVIGGLFLGHPDSGVFTFEHEQLVSAVAAQAAIALDNARMYEALNVLNIRKDQFINFASHELKTPLTTIKGYVQLVQMSGVSFLDFLPKIEKQIRRLEDITANLLDISKIQAGIIDYNFQMTDLSDVIRESIESIPPSAHKINVEKCQQDLKVVVDRNKLIQVIVNLLTNATKYSADSTTITISSAVSASEVRISITDEGIGIPREHLTDIFGQFYRVQTHAKTAKGMGLGLYIASEIIKAHDGKIWAESEPGIGSTFHILLPIQRRT